MSALESIRRTLRDYRAEIGPLLGLVAIGAAGAFVLSGGWAFAAMTP